MERGPGEARAAVGRPHVVAFDVVETLMSLEPLRARFVEIGLQASTLERWFALVLRDGMALTLARDYEPFPAVAASALRVVGDGELTDQNVEYFLAGLGELPAQPDAQPAMQVLSDAEITVVCLSNGAQDTTDAFLARNGLDRLVDQVISVADVGQWKPPPQVYQYALHRVGRAAAHEVALVAVHAFDCHGAHAVGLTTGWAARHERYYGDVYTPPDVAGADLVEVAEALVGLPESRDTDES